MCGAPKEQVVTQKTELDPALRRLLYGGTSAYPRGGFGSDTGGPSGTSNSSGTSSVGGGGVPTVGGEEGRDAGYDSYATPAGVLGYRGLRDTIDGGGPNASTLGGRGFAGPNPNASAGNDGPSARDRGQMYAYGGMVAPQQGLASLNQGQMPMMNGQMPNLSDPATAATLAMAVRRPELQYGPVMANPALNQMVNGAMSNFAMGGYVEGPGTGTSDSIPSTIYQNGMPVQEARLSDGEFVMTENAVKGAGNGDREAGAARMYRMMQEFERGGKV